MKKYLISGIAPSRGGVGYLMYNLEKLAVTYKYDVIYPKHINKSIRKNLFNPFFVINEILKRRKSKYTFASKLKTIKNSEVILIHPQTIGYESFLVLLKDNEVIKTYVMDNSFFCIKSYNILNGSECLKCLNDIDSVDRTCAPFPTNYDKDRNLSYLKTYQSFASKIIFYTQNNKQSDLVKNHFGKKTKVCQIGLKTGEFFEKDFVKDKNKQYDVVYHGANVEAKGFLYFIELAKKMHGYTFFIPYNSEKIPYSILPNNLICKDVTWNTGLKEMVINAKLVLCPSLWSAPIEGALLKSIHYNGNVGIVSTKYGFGNDIPNDTVLKLSADIHDATEQIYDFFTNSIDLSQRSRIWLSEFLSQDCNLEYLFMDVNEV